MRATLVLLAWFLAITAFSGVSLGPTRLAHAQPPAESDTLYTPPPPPPTSSRVTSHMQRTGEERDRVELGVAIPNGYFDFVGTFGYRRFVREGGPFEQSLMLEVGGTAKDHLVEGSLSLYYLLRPLRSYQEGWKLRPIVEAGPGGHIVVQSADIDGFDDSAFHSQGYLKAHLYLGFEFLLTNKFGFLARGRASVPEDHPLDYAQAAIFLR